jgi:predicted lipoprotein
LRAEVLEDLVLNVILPNNQLLLTKTIELNNAVANFNDNPNLTALVSVQNKWKVAQSQWELNCLFNIGPVKDQFLFYNIDIWPTNQTFVDNIIYGSDSINNAFIVTKGSTVKGLPAIESMVFNLIHGNQRVLDSLTNSPYSYRRKQYLSSLTQNLLIQVNKIDSIWAINQGNYYVAFINQTQNEVSGSYNVHLNNLIELLGYIILTKLERPMGVSAGMPMPDLSESLNSEHSLINIHQNFISIEKSLVGDRMNFKGINSLLDEIEAKKNGELLSLKIEEKLDSVKLLMNNLSSNSVPVAVANESSEINVLLDQIKDLYDLLRLDVADATNVIVTFSGNDGD